MEHTSQNNENRSEQVKIILLATQPRMLREMLQRALSASPDMRLVLETDKPHRIPSILDRIQADWLITTLTEDDRLPAPVQSALDQNPAVSVVGLSPDGSHAEVRWTKGSEEDRESQRYSLDDISLTRLLQILENEDSERNRE